MAVCGLSAAEYRAVSAALSDLGLRCLVPDHEMMEMAVDSEDLLLLMNGIQSSGASAAVLVEGIEI